MMFSNSSTNWRWTRELLHAIFAVTLAVISSASALVNKLELNLLKL